MERRWLLLAAGATVSLVVLLLASFNDNSIFRGKDRPTDTIDRERVKNEDIKSGAQKVVFLGVCMERESPSVSALLNNQGIFTIEISRGIGVEFSTFEDDAELARRIVSDAIRDGLIDHFDLL